MSTYRVSVILPVYNVAPFIGRCIESLRAQTMHELEFIFVDDCSTDNSMAEVEAWAAEDSRVRILRNEKNLGAGLSRNRGIETARGEYLSFVDPDDWVESDFYERLYGIAMESKSDIAKGVRVKVDVRTQEETVESDMNAMIASNLEQGKPLFLSFKYCHQSAIYSSTLFNDPVVRYGSSRNAQDVTFLLIVCSKAKTICFDERARYHYQYGRENAATSNCTAERSMRELSSLREQIDYLLMSGNESYLSEYLEAPLCVYLSRMYLATKNEDVSPDTKMAYTEGFTEQLLRIPHHEHIMEEAPEFDALVEHGAIIPPYRHKTEATMRDRLEGWASFLEGQEDAEQCYICACSSAAVVCALDGLRNGRIESGFIREQLEKLSPTVRKRVSSAHPGQLAHTLSDVVKRRVAHCFIMKRNGAGRIFQVK